MGAGGLRCLLMRIHHAQVGVKTTARISLENITAMVLGELEKSGIADGMAVLSVPHTTCGLVVNEDERGLRQDILRLVDRLLTPLAAERDFEHDCVDDNAQAHLTSLLLGHSLTLPVSGSRLSLGSWQSLFLVEMDGPRSRTINVQFLGE